jgi:hypothetical protein
MTRAASIVSVIALTMSTISPAFAADKYWIGGTLSSVWESNANWSNSPRGPTCSCQPTSSDIAIFSFSGGTPRMKSNVNVGGIMLASIWTGSVLQGTGSLTVGTSGIRIGSGRFIGGNQAIWDAGVFTQTGGIVSYIQNNLSLSGSFSIFSQATKRPSFTSTGTIIFSGNTDQNLRVNGALVTNSFKNMTLRNYGGGTADDIIGSGSLYLSGALTINTGNFDMVVNSMPLLRVFNGITLANNAQATLSSNQNISASGDILAHYNAGLSLTGGTLTLTDDSDQTITLNGPGKRFNNLTINNTGGGTNDDIVLAGSGLNLSGALTVTLGNLDLDTNNQALVVSDGAITIANASQATFATDANVAHSGALTANYNAGFALTGGTWTVRNDHNVTYTLNGPGKRFYNLTLNNTGGGTNDDLTFAGSGLNLSGALAITLGNLDLDTNNQELDVDGNLTIADTAQATFTGSTIAIGGNLYLGGNATFNHTNGTLTLDGGNQTLSGALVLNSLVKSVTSAYTLTFVPGPTYNIRNAFSVNGASSALLSLRSGTSGFRWKIRPIGSSTVSYVDVQDSENPLVTYITCSTGCTDSGNNVGWDFGVHIPGSTGGATNAGGGGRGGGGGGGGRATIKKSSSSASNPNPHIKAKQNAMEKLNKAKKASKSSVRSMSKSSKKSSRRR